MCCFIHICLNIRTEKQVCVKKKNWKHTSSLCPPTSPALESSVIFSYLFCIFVLFSCIYLCYCPDFNHVSSFVLGCLFFESANSNTLIWNEFVRQKRSGLFISRIKPLSTCCFFKRENQSLSVNGSFRRSEFDWWCVFFFFLSTVTWRFSSIYALNSLKACWSCSAKPCPTFWPHASSWH